MKPWGASIRHALILATLLPLTATAGETFFTQQGRLIDTAGQPIEGTHSVTLTLYSDESGTLDTWQRTYPTVAFESGYYTLPIEGLDENNPARELDTALSGSASTWLGVAVDLAGDMEPRQRLPSNIGPALPYWGHSINSSASSSHCTSTSSTPAKCDETNWPAVNVASRSGSYKVTFSGNVYGGTTWIGLELFVDNAWWGTGGHGNWHYGSGSGQTWEPTTMVWVVEGLSPNQTHQFNMGLRCNGGTCQIHHNSGTNSGGYGGKLLVEELR